MHQLIDFTHLVVRYDAVDYRLAATALYTVRGIETVGEYQKQF